jgi:hypothetical protein
MGAQIPDARSPWLQNFLPCCLIFLGPPLRKLFHFTLLYLEILGASQVFGKFFELLV